ncbi:hypothetical protein [Nodosilinea nodulosa]|uniref:hypothetical protein n=1 Tax=Nodosilinea nodulosa TaxID=416001 RepID=UPI00037B5D56|nr:hypothetical protein [Nodosilinea nodulosa]
MRRATFLALGGLVAAYVPAQAPILSPGAQEFALGQQPYGAQGSITEAELAVLKGLAWPQAYRDMVGTFGYPAHRTNDEDYYRLEGKSGGPTASISISAPRNGSACWSSSESRTKGIKNSWA